MRQKFASLSMSPCVPRSPILLVLNLSMSSAMVDIYGVLLEDQKLCLTQRGRKESA